MSFSISPGGKATTYVQMPGMSQVPPEAPAPKANGHEPPLIETVEKRRERFLSILRITKARLTLEVEEGKIMASEALHQMRDDCVRRHYDMDPEFQAILRPFERNFEDLIAYELDTEARRIEAKTDQPPKRVPAEPVIEPLELYDAGDWEGVPIEPQLWHTLDQIPAGEPGILGGEGGAGKTNIAQHLAVATCSDWPDWLSKPLNAYGPVIFFTAEEKLKQLHRRFDRILQSRGSSFTQLRKRLFIQAGDSPVNCLLATLGRDGVVKPTMTLARLEKSVALIKPALIVIENAADVFPEEIERTPIHQFVRGNLGDLCKINGATVMLLQQPSLSGLADKTGRSGSTGWTNAGRWRLNFRKNGAKEDDPKILDDGRRVLVTIKVNYGRPGEEIPIVWDVERHIFVPESSSQSPMLRAAAENAVDTVALKLLREQAARGVYFSPKPTANNNAPTQLAQLQEAKAAGIKKEAFRESVDRLYAAKRIETQPQPGKKASKAPDVIVVL